MAHISGHDRSQTLLFPESVDDYVDPDNPVRFIDAFVDGLDLTAAGFVGVEPKATGRPGYAPADLLKHYIYGYLNRLRSSRRLQAETCRNIEVIWLLRHLKPHFKTIADFRRDNRAALKPVFREFVLLCRRLDLLGRELLAIGGTRLKAVNNKDRNSRLSAPHAQHCHQPSADPILPRDRQKLPVNLCHLSNERDPRVQQTLVWEGGSAGLDRQNLQCTTTYG